jgi:hypothetical protein
MVSAKRPTHWSSQPVTGRPGGIQFLYDPPSAAVLLEAIRSEAELRSVARTRFPGPRPSTSFQWRQYSNLVRQGLAHLEAAVGVNNRSSSLLQYYGALNFAKAELLASRGAAVTGYVHHGLHFDNATAKTVRGDFVTVRAGVFPMLYEHRLGRPIPLNTKLPIKRLLAHIPELGSQLETTGITPLRVSNLWSCVASDKTEAWSIIAVELGRADFDGPGGDFIRAHYREVDIPPNWRNLFGVSIRYQGYISVYESKATYSHAGSGTPSWLSARSQAAKEPTKLLPYIEPPHLAAHDAWITPSLFASRDLPMPPSLARYALSFYASSLVRYRPAMLDPNRWPEQAYLFDAIARESPVPMLLDALDALTDGTTVFLGEGGFRSG